MFIEAQNTNSKKCLSCKRTRNYEYFGHSKTSRDGFNSNCLVCRNQIRRLQYGKSSEDIIFNLHLNNDKKLSSQFTEDIQLKTKAVLINNLTHFLVSIEINDCYLCYEITDQSRQNWICHSKFLIQVGQVDSLEKIKLFILNDLSNKSLRLFDTEDELLFLTEY